MIGRRIGQRHHWCSRHWAHRIDLNQDHVRSAPEHARKIARAALAHRRAGRILRTRRDDDASRLRREDAIEGVR